MVLFVTLNFNSNLFILINSNHYNKSIFPHLQLAPLIIGFNYKKRNSVSAVSSFEALSRIPDLFLYINSYYTFKVFGSFLSFPNRAGVYSTNGLLYIQYTLVQLRKTEMIVSLKESFFKPKDKSLLHNKNADIFPRKRSKKNMNEFAKDILAHLLICVYSVHSPGLARLSPFP